MNLSGHAICLFLVASAAAGCVHRADIEISAVEIAASQPVGRVDLNGHEDTRPVDAETAAAGFIRVQFKTKADLKTSAAEHHFTIAALRPCGPDDVKGPQYRSPGSIFPADDGSYVAFFPGRLDQLPRHDPDGGVRSGWPDATLANGVCFAVSSLDMTSSGLRSDEIKLDRVAELLKR